MRLKLLSCEIFLREFCACVARSPHTVDVEFLPKGLHDIGAEAMRGQLQAALDRVDEQAYDAILLGYGLCNNGIAGLAARQKPLVVPRAHDCITLFMGSAARYMDYFHNHPGVYFKTTGWVERGDSDGELSQLALGRRLGLKATYEELVARYGEDNARYLWQEFGNLEKHYGQFTFIEMGVEPGPEFEQRVREEAAERGWKFEKLAGDMGLMERLVNGDWNEEEFLIVPPGFRIVAKYNEGVIAAEPTDPQQDSRRRFD
jgi:Protein of unknown function (DUF1638)